MTAVQLINTLENEGMRLEARGKQIWVSDRNIPGALLSELKTRRDEVLRYLRQREYDRLTASARTLADFLDDTSIGAPVRLPRLPEYEQLLEQIAELQPYIDTYEEAR